MAAATKKKAVADDAPAEETPVGVAVQVIAVPDGLKDAPVVEEYRVDAGDARAIVSLDGDRYAFSPSRLAEFAREAASVAYELGGV